MIDQASSTVSNDFGVAATERPALSAPTRFLARQPIVDAKMKLHGYELLHRVDASDSFTGDSMQASQQVIDNCLLLMPELEQSKNFVKCTREILVTELATLLPRRGTVLEILDEVEPDAEVLTNCRFLRKKGYTFALDNFLAKESRRPFLDLAEYVKIDFRATSAEERRAIYAMAANARNEVKLVAKKLESAEEVEMARKEGCTYFQGFFIGRPKSLSHQPIPNNQLVCLRLMAALSEEPPDTAKIERLVMMDTALCYRLLRLVNSALYSLGSQVTSIRGALVIIGTDEFRKLVTVSLAGVLAQTHSKPLVALALERARFCEGVAPRLKEDGPKMYLLGMMSLIDAILEVSMFQVLSALPLDPDMKAALTGATTSIGVALDLVRCYQAGDWAGCEAHQRTLGLEEAATSKLYLDAVRWADEAMRQ